MKNFGSCTIEIIKKSNYELTILTICIIAYLRDAKTNDRRTIYCTFHMCLSPVKHMWLRRLHILHVFVTRKNICDSRVHILMCLSPVKHMWQRLVHILHVFVTSKTYVTSTREKQLWQTTADAAFITKLPCTLVFQRDRRGEQFVVHPFGLRLITVAMFSMRRPLSLFNAM